MLNDEMYAKSKELPTYTACSLDLEEVNPIPNSHYVFIDCNLPIVSLIRHNSHLL